MSGFDQSSIAVSMPTVVGADAALGGPYKIKPSEAFSGALMTVSGLTGETISVETSPDGYWGAPASPTFYRTDWQGTQLLYPTARTNNIIQSGDQSNVAYTKVLAAITGPVTGPDGALSAYTLTTSGVGYIFGSKSAVGVGSPFASSLWIKRRSGTSEIRMLAIDGSTFNKVVTVGSEWTRVTNTGVTGGTAIAYCGFNLVGTGDSVDVAFFQTEPGSTVTSYIPTVAAPVTVTDYTLSGGVITLAQAPITGATLSYDNSVLPSPYYIFATGDGVRTQFAYDGVWGTLSANSGKGNGIWQVDLRGAQAYRLVKSAGSETATVNMTLKRDALQYTNSAGTWSVT